MYGGQYGQGQQNLNYLDPEALAAQKAYLASQQGRTSDASGAANAAAGGFYQNLLNSGGYSDEVKNAIAQTSNDAETEKLAEANHNLQMHGAATGNDAGFAGATANLYGTAATDQAARTRENQIAFANEQQRQKELGGAGMERLLGVNQAAALGLSGQNNQLSQLLSGTSNTSQNLFNQTGQNNTTTHGTGSSTTVGGGANAGGGGGGVGDILCQLFHIGCPAGGTGTCNPPCTLPQICQNGKCVDPKGGGGGGGGGTGGGGTPGGGGKGKGGCNTGYMPDPTGKSCTNDPDSTECPDGSQKVNGVCTGCDSSQECCPGDTEETNGNCGGGTPVDCGSQGLCEDSPGSGVCVECGGGGCEYGEVQCSDGSCVSDPSECGGGGGGGECEQIGLCSDPSDPSNCFECGGQGGGCGDESDYCYDDWGNCIC